MLKHSKMRFSEYNDTHVFQYDTWVFYGTQTTYPGFPRIPFMRNIIYTKSIQMHF